MTRPYDWERDDLDQRTDTLALAQAIRTVALLLLAVGAPAVIVTLSH